jgi:hypothetical protein
LNHKLGLNFQHLGLIAQGVELILRLGLMHAVGQIRKPCLRLGHGGGGIAGRLSARFAARAEGCEHKTEDQDQTTKHSHS